jgi:hypothetical protein
MEMADPVSDLGRLTDLVAVCGQALARWLAVIERLAPIQREINGVLSEALAQRYAGGNQDSVDRLAIVQQLGTALEEPSNRLMEWGTSYSRELIQVNPLILTLIRSYEEDPSKLKGTKITELLDELQRFAGIVREQSKLLRQYSDVLPILASVAPALEGSMRKLQQGLRGPIDGQALIDEWDKRIRELPRNHSS